MNPAAKHFASELRIAREMAGMSQAELAAHIPYSKSAIAMIEAAQRVPSTDFATRIDEVFETSGRFQRIRRDLLCSEVNPSWFKQWVHIEAEAVEIRTFALAAVPGLLQTRDYAAALVGSDEAAEARLMRQEIFDTDAPPRMVAVIDQYALSRRVGSAEVMVGQLDRLLTPPSTVKVCVLPEDAETHLSADGPFTLASTDGVEHVHCPTAARGFTLEDPQTVSAVRERWETIIAESLPPGSSRKLIKECLERWKNDT